MSPARIVFRIVIALTLAVMTIGRFRGHMPRAMYAPFSSWFLVSVLVFGIFGLVSAYHAFREPHNRRAYLTDVLLAAAWIPYWFANLQRVPALFR